MIPPLLLLLASSLAAHDLFIKLDSYRVPPGTAVRAPVLNGTFSSSENAITPDRVADMSLVGPAGRKRLDHAAVSARNDSTFLAFETGDPGTYAIGFSTKPREIRLSGKDFATYLGEEGLEDVLAERRGKGTAGDSATERYSKHVKAVFQVGEARSADFGTVFGYPAEIVPLDNPSDLRPGSSIRIRCLADGAPAANVVVIAGGRTPRGARIASTRVRTDREGMASIRLGSPGKWYLKFIRMSPRTEGAGAGAGAGADYESVWATVTFEVGR